LGLSRRTKANTYIKQYKSTFHSNEKNNRQILVEKGTIQYSTEAGIID
jgi:hypothetical protein